MHLALLIGGTSAERPISLKSAEWIKKFLSETSHTYDVYDVPEEIDIFLAKYKTYDVVVPYIHGQYGEDGVLTGLCEALGLHYAGSPSTTHALCIDKFRANCIVEQLRLAHIPKSWIPGMNSVKLIWLSDESLSPSSQGELPMSVIVKPNYGWSSVATNKAESLEQLRNGLEEVYINLETLWTQVKHLDNLSQQNQEIHFKRHFPKTLHTPIVQECIDGEEYTVGLVGPSEMPEVLPMMQIVNVKAALFNWQEKYESDGSNEIFPDDMDPDLRKQLEQQSKKIYTALGCRGVARIDYRVRDGVPYFLEVNTFPGMTPASFIPKMWQKTGRTMGEFMEMYLQTIA